MFVGLDIAQLSNNIFEEVIPVRAEEVDIGCNKLVNREDVGHLDIQRRFGLGIKVVEFINVEI